MFRNGTKSSPNMLTLHAHKTSRQADDARRVRLHIKINLVVRGLDRQARDERDGAEGDDNEARARRHIHILDVHLEAARRAELRRVVGERVPAGGGVRRSVRWM